jgi:hypothetical protein
VGVSSPRAPRGNVDSIDPSESARYQQPPGLPQ